MELPGAFEMELDNRYRVGTGAAVEYELAFPAVAWVHTKINIRLERRRVGCVRVQVARRLATKILPILKEVYDGKHGVYNEDTGRNRPQSEGVTCVGVCRGHLRGRRLDILHRAIHTRGALPVERTRDRQ